MITDLFIKNLQLQNYKSIRNLDVRFNKGLNIIIGENGAGKTNLLEYIVKIFKDDFAPYKKIRHNISNEILIYKIEVESNNNDEMSVASFKRIEELKRNHESSFFDGIHFSTWKKKNEMSNEENDYIELSDNTLDENSQLLELLFNVQLKTIHFNDPKELNFITNPSGLEYDIKYRSVLTDVSSNTYFLTIFFNFLADKLAHYNSKKINKEEIISIVNKTFKQTLRKTDIVSYLKKFTPINDIKLNESINIYTQNKQIIIDNVQLIFKVNGNWLPWSYLSDGTKRIFYIILEAINPEKNIVLIEEPELGIHPHQLYKLMNFLKEMAEEKQIIITTHSPIALDVLSPEELDAIIIAKYTPKGTVMNHLTPTEAKKAKVYIEKTGNLSAYWLHSDLEK